MINIPGRIPVTINPIFWVVAGVIGWFNSGSFIGMIMWILIILLSVLVHEFGHAITALIFKKEPRIEVIALGGVTAYDGSNLKFWQQFIIVFNGPLFGFFLFLLSYAIIASGIVSGSPIIYNIFNLLKFVNLFWTLVNLLPVMPLDGGQLLRIVLEAFFGLKGFKISIFIGMIVSIGISLFFFAVGSFLIGAVFFILAFQSFDMWKKSRHLSTTDRNEDNAKLLKEGETALEQGNIDQARSVFNNIRSITKNGVVFVAATHYLAMLDFKDGKLHESYQLLLSVKDHLEKEGICLLQQLAYDEKNYDLVATLSSECYQFMPSQEVALRNARAFAYLNKAKHAGGWLGQAQEIGKLDVKKILDEKIFDTVKKDPLFTNFFRHQ
jgi:stage IV sporulation protein FB